MGYPWDPLWFWCFWEIRWIFRHRLHIKAWLLSGVKRGRLEDHQFMVDVSIQSSIYSGFPVAMFDYRRVLIDLDDLSWPHVVTSLEWCDKTARSHPKWPHESSSFQVSELLWIIVTYIGRYISLQGFKYFFVFNHALNDGLGYKYFLGDSHPKVDSSPPARWGLLDFISCSFLLG